MSDHVFQEVGEVLPNQKRVCLILLYRSALQRICWLHPALHCKLDFSGQTRDEEPSKHMEVHSFAS